MRDHDGFDGTSGVLLFALPRRPELVEDSWEWRMSHRARLRLLTRRASQEMILKLVVPCPAKEDRGFV